MGTEEVTRGFQIPLKKWKAKWPRSLLTIQFISITLVCLFDESIKVQVTLSHKVT